MKTDQAIYQYLATGAEAFRVLTGGMVLPGPYQFSAPALKGKERRIDALFEPLGHAGPAYIVEFQAQRKPAAWYNLLAKMGLYGEEYPKAQLHGVLIFPRRKDEAKQSRWMGHIAPNLLSAVYLEDFLPTLLATEPNNPFVAVFAPLVIANDAELRQQAPQLWRAVHTAPIAEQTRVSLEQILTSWFFERFKTLSEQEVLTMLEMLTPLEETRAYKSIFAKGEARGEARGRTAGKAEGEAKGKAEGEAKGKAEGAALVLKRLIIRRFKKLPKWAEQRIDGAETTQLEAWAEAIFEAESVEQLLI